MSESTSTLVECPVCEEEFDPGAAGGWCTNSDCGEWRYEEGDAGDDTDVVDDADTTDAGGDSADDVATESDPTPAIEPADRTETGDDNPAADAASEDEGADATVGEEAVEAGAGTVGEAAGTVETDGTESGESEADEPEATATTAESPDEAAEIECPGCGERLDADANFCPSCGEDVSDIEPGEDDGELTDCPSCGADVGPEDSFCASCGEDLDAHRGTEELTECPGCGSDIDPDDSFCVSCGEDLDAHRESGATATDESDDTPEADAVASDPAAAEEPSAPDSLVLDVRGEELTVGDGDTVGRELRRIITETGGDEDDAVRVHREHVRFEREDGRFYLVDLGRNPTRLNEQSLSEGDREPIGPGDELTLSGIVTLAVRAP